MLGSKGLSEGFYTDMITPILSNRVKEIYGCQKREFRYRSCKPTEMIVFICILRALLLKTHQLSLDAFVVALRAMQVRNNWTE